MKLQVALIFGEHMVLQREKPIRIWGTCASNDVVTVKLNKQCVSAEAQRGRWCAVLEPENTCSCTSLEICSQVTGERIRFDDIAIGEVWLAGGQSNMEFRTKDIGPYREKALKDADNSAIRFIDPQDLSSYFSISRTESFMISLTV